jgi:hypothetical protein
LLLILKGLIAVNARKWRCTVAALMSAIVAQAPWSMPQVEKKARRKRTQLTAPDLREIDDALSGVIVQGGRMNEEQMRIVDQTV